MEQPLPSSPSPLPQSVPAQPPVPPPAAPPPPPARPMPLQTKKGTSPILVAILGLLVVAGIAYAGLSLWQRGLLGGLLSKPTPTPTLAPEPTPTLDPTAGWKTYINTTFGFSVKYPETWFSNNCGKKDTLLLSPIGTPICETEPNESIQFFVNQNTNSLEKLLEEYEKAGWSSEAKSLADLPAEATAYSMKKISPAPGPDNFSILARPLEKEIFVITVNDPKQEQTAIKILSTFEFLTPTPTGTQTKGGITQEAGTPVKIKSISLVSPTKGPLVIKGTVESGWMFEGVMPVKLLDATRAEIATASAKETVPGSWQSGKAVEFSVSLTFTTESASGYLVFRNDNPSGLPQNQKSFEIPVKFRQ